MAEHRVPLLGERWRRFEDPQRSRDPHIRALVGQLQNVAVGPAPDPVFRAELRAQLVAIAPRLVADGIAEGTAMVDIVPAKPVSAVRTAGHAPEIRRFRFGRVLGVATTMIVAFALLLGGAVVLSKKALPGDTLYGLKRASEQFELTTDGSDTERASDLLSFAATRTDEVQQLINRSSATAAGPGAHAGAINESTGRLIESALASANSDTADASRLLGTQAIRDGSATPLTNMTNWAPGQLARLRSIWAALPDGLLRSATRSSVELVSSAQTRAKQLITSVDCACAAQATTDTLGPKPCTACPTTAAQNPTQPSRSGATRSNSPAQQHTQAPVGRPSHLKPVPGKPVTSPVIPPLSSVSTPAPPTGLLPVLPSLPEVLPSKPVSISTCGVQVNILGIKVNLGTCPPSH